jgi:DNA-binding response OmpR family regulator
MAHILIAEDDSLINELIAKNLKLAGHDYAQVYTGHEAVRAASDSKSEIDLILLDIMLPGLSGFEVIQKIPEIPVIFVTAKDELDNRLAGLNYGADDYITKPFEMLELLARVEAVLRRTQKAEMHFSLGNACIDFASRSVQTVDGTEIELSPQEFSLLELLIQNKNIALSRAKLLDMAWGYDFVGESRTVDTHIQRLRSKLGWEDHIKTVYKFGYRLVVK